MRIVNGILFLGLFILLAMWFMVYQKEDKALRPGLIFLKKHIAIVFLLLAVNVISLSQTFVKEDQEIVIEKNEYGGEEKQVGFLLKKEDTTETVTIEVRPREFTKEQAEGRMADAFIYLDTHLKGENISLSHITESLDFFLDYEEYPFDVEFWLEDYALINGDGEIKNKREELAALGYPEDQQNKGITTKLKVSLQYGEMTKEKIYELVVFPKEESVLEKQFAKVKEQIEAQENKALYDEQLILPATIEDVQITRADANRVSPAGILFIGFLAAGLLLLREQENLRIQERKRQEQLRRSYPWFVNEVVLLFGAGMQMKNILSTLINEYEAGTKNQRLQHEDYREALICELKKAQHSLDLGMPEEQIYYQLGRRLKLPCYIKLMTLLEQNVKRGTKGLTDVFEQEEVNALEERKNLAKRYGEEAGTKLLGPMILLLIIIMLIVMIPAFLSFA